MVKVSKKVLKERKYISFKNLIYEKRQKQILPFAIFVYYELYHAIFFTTYYTGFLKEIFLYRGQSVNLLLKNDNFLKTRNSHADNYNK